MAGRFITLEGGEGVGKSTQLRLLAAALHERGLAVVETREPGGSPGAEAVRSLLMEGAIERWSVRSEALLFAAARANHVELTIMPALAREQWVLCDRFLDSSIAYQGIVGGLGAEAIRRLHEIGSTGFLPDRTLLLRLDDKEAARRAFERGGSDRFGDRAQDFHVAVHRAFDELAAQDPSRIRIVDAGASEASVTAKLLAQLEDWL